MIENAHKSETVSYICWLCGHIENAKPSVKSMHAERCPNCHVESAFRPLPQMAKN